MKIGRKIYFELATGNVILGMGERQGDVVETTQEQDFQAYAALQPYQSNAVGVIQLAFGQFVDNFEKYPYHIDITKNPIDALAIIWDTANPYGATLPEIQVAKIAQLQDFYNQTLAAGFPSTANGTSIIYGFAPDDQTNLSQELNIVNAGLATFPIPWGAKDGITVVNLDEVRFKQLCKDANDFKWSQVGKLRELIGQVQAATTVDAVNVIAW